jgi:hypothetical protein
MAMLGFAGIALAELKTQVPAGEQLAGDVFGVLLLSLTFTLASIFPKFSTGRPLRVSSVADLGVFEAGCESKGQAEMRTRVDRAAYACGCMPDAVCCRCNAGQLQTGLGVSISKRLCRLLS